MTLQFQRASDFRQDEAAEQVEVRVVVGQRTHALLFRVHADHKCENVPVRRGEEVRAWASHPNKIFAFGTLRRLQNN